MKAILILIIIIFSSINAFSAENFYDLKAVKNGGDTLHFSELKGKKLMIVNTASKCGYTPQYEDLQALYEKYGGDNFEIIAFPANNFAGQEPGDDDDIKDFCESNYGITFTLMSKISVKGTDIHPVYEWLTQKNKNGVMDSQVAWNFQKYLIDENGLLFKMIPTQTKPNVQVVIDWLETPVSVQENKDTGSINIFPNPAQTNLNINVNSIMDFEVLSINGISQDKGTLEPGLNHITVSNLPAGMYVLRIGDENYKIIKE